MVEFICGGRTCSLKTHRKKVDVDYCKCLFLFCLILLRHTKHGFGDRSDGIK